MSFNLYDLDHAPIVKEAIEIMEPILQDNYRLTDVRTNSAGYVIFTLLANGEIKNMSQLFKISKPFPSGTRTEFFVNFDTGVRASFYNCLSNGGGITLDIDKNGGQVFSMCL